MLKFVKKAKLLLGIIWRRRNIKGDILKNINQIGLIAGVGRLPVEFTQIMQAADIKVAAIAVVDGVDEELANVADSYLTVSIGQLQTVINQLKAKKISVLTMLGKVSKELLFAPTAIYDERFAKVLNSLPDRADDTLMLGFVRELDREGITVINQTLALKRLFVSAGLVAGREPSENEKLDMKYALKMARSIGQLDIGQTVVVKNQAIIAVEAVEGTDACIRRSGKLANGGAIVGKTAKPQQDQRFDVPAIGPDTIQALIDSSASGMVIEAGRTLVIDLPQIKNMAAEHNLTIMAMD